MGDRKNGLLPTNFHGYFYSQTLFPPNSLICILEIIISKLTYYLY